VRDHLAKDQQAWADRELAAAFSHGDLATPVVRRADQLVLTGYPISRE
jgi:hypothetical protein